MKRFITYVYVYENGVKGKNVGFIKVEIRDGNLRIEMQIRNLGRYQGVTEVYLVVPDATHEKGIRITLGEMEIRYGSGNAFFEAKEGKIGTSHYDFSQVVGMWMGLDEAHELASCWVEQADHIVMCKAGTSIQRSDEMQNHCIRNKEKIQQIERKEVKPEIEGEKEQAPQDQTPIQQVSEKVKCFTDFRRIDIKEIRNFPKQNWYLCNNSFLIHGFFNYHYLMLKKVKEGEVTKYYLGVPGIYDKPERMMALLFGFPEFEAVPQEGGEQKNIELKEEDTLMQNTNNQTQQFGYWYCLLDM